MTNNQFPQYPQKLEDDISALSDYLFEKYNDAFDDFYFEECDRHDIDINYGDCAIDELWRYGHSKVITNYVS